MEDNSDRIRKQAMGAPVPPAATGAQLAIDLAAGIGRQQPGRAQAPAAHVSQSYRTLLLKLAASLAAFLAGAAMVLLESNIFIGAILGFGGLLFGLITLGNLLRKAAGSMFQSGR